MKTTTTCYKTTAMATEKSQQHKTLLPMT